MYRQGDVFFERIECSTRGLTPVVRESGRVVLAHGEVTGHSHAIQSKHANLWEDANRMRVLEVQKPVTLRHEEHASIQLPRGFYRVTIQREYSPAEVRNVAD